MTLTAADHFAAWHAEVLQRTEQALTQILPARDALEDAHPLPQAMAYAVLGGGKRIRPVLAHAAGLLTAADPRSLDAVACAVELIHAYSLVHDDLPCMDNDVLRRGRPTVHVVYGQALAMLVGDALQALAFAALAKAHAAGVSAEGVVRMTHELAQAAGALGMAGGQALDLSVVGVAVDQPFLQAMHGRKTGALLRAALRLGAWSGPECLSANDEHALDAYATAVGLAFQVVDDVLDVEGDQHLLGKTAGKDAQQAKPTFVSLLGLTGARACAAQLREQAHDALVQLGPRAHYLRHLADLIVWRKA